VLLFSSYLAANNKLHGTRKSSPIAIIPPKMKNSASGIPKKIQNTAFHVYRKMKKKNLKTNIPNNISSTPKIMFSPLPECTGFLAYPDFFVSCLSRLLRK